MNSFTTGGQFGAEVAMRNDGSFVVSWTSAGSFGSDNSGYGIQGVPSTPRGRRSRRSFR